MFFPDMNGVLLSWIGMRCKGVKGAFEVSTYHPSLKVLWKHKTELYCNEKWIHIIWSSLNIRPLAHHVWVWGKTSTTEQCWHMEHFIFVWEKNSLLFRHSQCWVQSIANSMLAECWKRGRERERVQNKCHLYPFLENAIPWGK